MRKLTKSVEKRIAIQLGLSVEVVRQQVAKSESDFPGICIIPGDDGVCDCGYEVEFPPCDHLPDGGSIVITTECFVKENKDDATNH